MPLPLGIRSNNPGNIRSLNVWWRGQTGVNSYGFCEFDSPEHGIRALAKQLLRYQRKYEANTVREIISRWAPSNENNTEAYIQAVCRSFAAPIQPDYELDLENPWTLERLVNSIIKHENGQNPYPEDLVRIATHGAILE